MDPTDLGPGTATWLGGTGTVLLGGFLWLRKFLSKDAADRAMDNADIGTVRRLNELLDSEREPANLQRPVPTNSPRSGMNSPPRLAGWRERSKRSPGRYPSSPTR